MRDDVRRFFLRQRAGSVQVTTLLISENFPPKTGGSGRWFWEIYSRLPRDQFLVAAGEDHRQEALDATHDLRVVRLPLTMQEWGLRSVKGLKGYCRVLPRLRKLVRQNSISRIHCGRCLPEGVMALVLRYWLGVPYCCYVHGEDVTTACESRELTMIVKRVLGRADLIFANSQNTKQILKSQWRLSDEKVRVLYPGVDTKHFRPAERSTEVRQQLGWNDRLVVLTVGRLQMRKGQDQLIRALPAIRQAIPNVLYSIVGDGAEREHLESLVDSEGVRDLVDFRGEPDDGKLVQCYQQCDLFVLPNRQVGSDIEGFGMVLLEAQACGKPVLAGASGGTAETMRGGATGEVVPCDAPGPLADAIIALLRDTPRRAEMGEAARHWVVEHFDWKHLSQQAAQLFQISVAGNEHRK